MKKKGYTNSYILDAHLSVIHISYKGLLVGQTFSI